MRRATAAPPLQRPSPATHWTRRAQLQARAQVAQQREALQRTDLWGTAAPSPTPFAATPPGASLVERSPAPDRGRPLPKSAAAETAPADQVLARWEQPKP